MAILGLGILIATISYFCYRNVPTIWHFFQWFHQPVSLNDGQDIPEKSPIDIDVTETKENNAHNVTNTLRDSIPTIDTPIQSSKTLQDRKAMPPPPLILQSPPAVSQDDSLLSSSSPTTPKATTEIMSNIPSLSISNDEEDSEPEDQEPTSQFPALHSAQRANKPSTQMLPPALPNMPAPPPPRTTNLMSPPIRSPLPNRLIPGLDPARNISNPISKSPRSLGDTLSPTPSRLGGGQGLAPPPTHNSIPTKPRQKVQLSPGHSPLDWANLSRSPTANLNGLPPNMPYLRVPPSLLKQMNGRPIKDASEKSLLQHPRIDSKGRECKDAWTVLSGKVYNITAYLPYHPGGVEETLKCAGRDGTNLFGEVHPWVNWENMLEGCLVGVAISEEEWKRKNPVHELDDMD